MSLARKTKSSQDGDVEASASKKAKLPGVTAIPADLLMLEISLCAELDKITFQAPVEYVYNPLEYALDVHTMYVHKYCTTVKKILFLGMNPGPWGMCQTGVPFGDVSMVRDWLNLSGSIGKPTKEHPNKKVTGFQCPRSEVSGKRFWSLFQQLCGDPEKFFANAYMHNYCPLALLNGRGTNITPAELKGEESKKLQQACDQALAETIKLLGIEIVVGIGRYAEKRAQLVVKEAGLSVQVVFVAHPSPRAAHKENWNDKATRQLSELELLHFFTK